MNEAWTDRLGKKDSGEWSYDTPRVPRRHGVHQPVLRGGLPLKFGRSFTASGRPS